jgi:murein DD-endopeptidase MepM/ murein hydrolase activator NlpD
MSSPRGRATAALLLLTLWACLGAASPPATAGPRDRLERIDRSRERVLDRIERVDAVGTRLAKRISALDNKRTRVDAALEDLNRKIAGLDRALGTLADRLSDAQHRIAVLSERIALIQARLAEREGLFHERAVSAYKTGATGAFDTLLSAASLSDLINRFTYVLSALDSDAELLSEIKALEEEASLKRAEVERRREEISANKTALQEIRTRMARVRDRKSNVLAARQAAIASKRSLLVGVRAREGKLRDLENQLEGESARIEALLAARAAGVAAVPGAGGQLSWPAAGPVTSGFGYRIHPIFGDRRVHTGIDIAAPNGAPVYAAAEGVVAYVGALSGYGNVVAIDHGEGLATTYNHLSAYYVSTGQQVERSEHIAAVGCTGFCTGPHLHFEVRVNGTPVDPMPYLQ